MYKFIIRWLEFRQIKNYSITPYNGFVVSEFVPTNKIFAGHFYTPFSKKHYQIIDSSNNFTITAGNWYGFTTTFFSGYIINLPEYTYEQVKALFNQQLPYTP